MGMPVLNAAVRLDYSPDVVAMAIADPSWSQKLPIRTDLAAGFLQGGFGYPKL